MNPFNIEIVFNPSFSHNVITPEELNLVEAMLPDLLQWMEQEDDAMVAPDHARRKTCM